jgi:hypothetical protein
VLDLSKRRAKPRAGTSPLAADVNLFGSSAHPAFEGGCVIAGRVAAGVWWGMRFVIRLRSVACGVGVCAVAVIVLAGCGSSAPTVAQLRETVQRYLSATTTAERCQQLLTTVYRTENPDVVLSGGCQQNQEVSVAEEVARRTLRIARIDVHGDHATVALAPRTAVDRERGVPHLTGLELETERGEWRIDGFTEIAHGTVTITSPRNGARLLPWPGRPSGVRVRR